MPSPFEAEFDDVNKNLDFYVDEVFQNLHSEFLVMPKGNGFVEYPVFEAGYETLKHETAGFTKVGPDRLLAAVSKTPMSFVVLRCILGFTPPEWAYYASRESGVEIPQGSARTIDRNIRVNPAAPLKLSGKVRAERIHAMISAAAGILSKGVPQVAETELHRLAKVDTTSGQTSLGSIASLGVPYPVLLYERFLGRPFAGHRDSISELVGNIVENAIEDVLSKAGVSYRKTKRAEKVQGFDQAPDFIVPNEFNPQIVIEAKLTEDDGTARDKVTRIQHLRSLSLDGMPPGDAKFEVVACIAGRGFGVRREDMKKLLLATRGKVFTLKEIGRLIECTAISKFKTK